MSHLAHKHYYEHPTAVTDHFDAMKLLTDPSRMWLFRLHKYMAQKHFELAFRFWYPKQRESDPILRCR